MRASSPIASSHTLATEMDVMHDPMAVGASIGVALLPAGRRRTPKRSSSNADTALYRAKNNGRGHAAFFDQEMDELARERRDARA
jgi:predicted signal transduction protein with EAL and GGDEF domain